MSLKPSKVRDILICALASVLVFACAGTTPPPEVERATLEPINDPPVYVERDVDAELLNRDELLQLMRNSYPKNLKKPGIDGEVGIWVFVNGSGEVKSTRFDRRSRYSEFNETAMEIAKQMRFTPAERNGRPVATWVFMPFTFSTHAVSRRY